MELRGLDKEIEMPLPTTSGYNPSNRDSSSSPTLASTAGETTSDHQPPQSSDHHHHHHHHHHPSLPSNHLQQLQRNTRDPDPPSVTASAITPIASRSNPRPAIRYRECLKNHAASTGRHVVDGCGEFMPSGEEGTPQSLRCAACDCHRNFHRKETDGEPQTNVLNYYAYPPSKSNNAQSRILSPQFPPPPPSLHHHHQQQHMRFSGGSFPRLMMAFGGGGGVAESSSEDLNMFQCNEVGGQGSVQAGASSKKRFRTKFSQEQKERMMEFAEKLGWRIQKHDEQEVLQFCNQLGVKRQVFKVWMHNNKQAMKKKQM